MNIEGKAAQKKIMIKPGEYYASNRRVLISTLLGSCVAACLYDSINGVVGMNHFLLSDRGNAKESPSWVSNTGRYGVHAMELVINEMFKLGAERRHLKAKVFGGSSLFQSGTQTDSITRIGEANSRFILEFLKNDGIPIIAYDLGGNQGRTIYFSSDDYSVMVKRTSSTSVSELLRDEKRLWRRFVRRHTHKNAEIDLWIKP